MFKPALAALLAISTASPALAQNGADDWDFGRDAETKLVIAAVSFESFGIAVRCRDGVLGVVASGLPAGSGELRLKYSMAGSAERETPWLSPPRSQTAFAIWPASIAADLRKGGRLSLGVPDGERTGRIAVDLPPSTSSIDQVLAACDRDIPIDSNDQPSGPNMSALEWRRPPEPSFPSRTGSEAGVAALLCNVNATGSLRGCTVESEFPEGGGFGRAATLGAHRTGRVGIPDGQTGVMEGRQIAFVVRYRMGVDMTPTPSRLPARDLP
ncbi:MAG: TonB family protein [Brevundimonas sp.]|nr:TonB family protein [Brevundimonas sp.]